MKILELVSSTPGGLTLSSIMRRLGLPAGTSHYILTRLQSHAFLSREPEDKRYKIGIKLVAIAHAALRDLGLRHLAEPALRQLAAETRLGAFIGVLEQNAIMIVGKVEQPGMLPMNMEIGVRYPAHRTALGKAILAHRTRPQLLAFCHACGLPGASLSRNLTRSFLAQLTEVRRKGYAVNDEELFIGFRALAAPVVDSEEHAVAAISATGPRFQLDDPTVVAAVKRAARDISKRRQASGFM
ncbi:MAG: IclR family transcriptional regulator [Acidobacteria bacterium]|nr:IclR family transcriptional regulator [Acidobacteriota bacterium]